MSETIFKQTVIMLVLIIVGVICAKTRMIGKETNRDLSGLVLNVINPVVILMSYQKEYRPELLKKLGMSFLLSAVAFAVMIALSYLLIRKKDGRETEIERFSLIYSNCGFMGIPIVSALFGSEGVFCLTAFITMFNLCVWTHGIMLISGESGLKRTLKALRSPTMIAIYAGLIMFLTGIRIPALPSQALQFIADMNTPMAMIVSGVTISQTNIFRLVKNLRIWVVVGLRLLVLPIVVTAALLPFSSDSQVLLTVVVASAAPPAAMCTLHCIRFNKNSVYSSEVFTGGTILSIVTLPILVHIAEKALEQLK